MAPSIAGLAGSAVARLAEAIAAQRGQRLRPAEFAAWGHSLHQITEQLREIAQMLNEQVDDYGDGAGLRDEAGPHHDPRTRLAVARGELTRLGEALLTAAEAAGRYHEAISQVSVHPDS